MPKKKDRAQQEENLAALIERDLTALARDKRLPVGHGLDGPVSEVASLLVRGGKAPLLGGDQGVGKSAIVQELARRIAEGSLGPPFDDMRVVEVPAAGIFARTSSPRAAAELFEELLEHLSKSPSIVFLRDVGMVQGSSLAPVLLRALRAGRLRFVFESELQRANELLRSDETLAERLHLVVVNEPTPERARWILGRVAEELEAELNVPIDPSACDMALRLSVKFLLSQRLPRKAIELLRETAVEAAGAARERIGAEEVLSRFSSATRLPRFVADDAMPLDLGAVQKFFAERLLGQEDALGAVLRSVALLKAGLNDPRRPLGVFLFSGPTGVGKTHLAKLLAEFLFGASDRLVRLNMADYPEDGDESVVFGGPWSQTLQGKRGELTRLLDGKAFAVLLLDEFEKAARKCHDRFLQLFDEGRFVNAAGETVACNNVLIVATSNVGADVYTAPQLGFTRRAAEELTAEVDRRIAQAFRPEFLNRFDAVCHFRPLGKVEIRRIAQREVGRVLERDGIRARGLEVEVASEVVDLLVERGYSPNFGARFLQREIEKTLTAALAVEIARAPLPQGTPVKVVVHKGVVHAIAEPKLKREKAPTAQVELPSSGALTTRRRLDRSELIREAESLMDRAMALWAAAGRPLLEEKRQTLLTETMAPGFWEDSVRAAATLRVFRAVDAELAQLDALREACHAARRRAREAKGEVQLTAAAQVVEKAAREVQLFEARIRAGTGGDSDEAWLDICASGEGPAHESWVRELMHLYLGWAEKRRFEGKVVAVGEEPARVVLQVTGPGAYSFLASERGAHRRVDDQTRVAAVVRLHRPVSTVEESERVKIDVRDIKRRASKFTDKVGCEAAARDEATGRALVLFGTGTVAELKPLARAVLEGQGGVSDEARRYFVGRGARVEDPRTGAFTPRVKDVLRGEIDQFVAAWVARAPEVAQ